ncbi:ribosome biogenesis GTPase Der [Candidatus Kapabacteria bacterium]|nr:ribosome biogenesis GTPase Der [Candidatus Kapabacteria bacterium]
MNLVAIVGRPNVGKSTLFNRLIGARLAIVEDTPGVTRDRVYGKSEWNGKKFDVIDTGGFIPGSEDKIEKAIREQAMIAIEEADTIIFVVDGITGSTKFDEDLAVILRNSVKPIVLVVNKCDNEMADHNSYEFYSLGLGEPFPISAVNGRSTGDFLDIVTSTFSDVEEEETDDLKIAFLGRPNVGKSSLTNALLGVDRMIVTDIPGTTRDSIDSTIKYHGENIVLIDTAGLRKRAQVHENVEMWSTVRTARAIDRCDVGVLMIDATRGLEDQDKRILVQIEEARKGIIIAINKWDILEGKDEFTAHQIRKEIKGMLQTFDYVPVIFISAITKQRINKVLDDAKEIQARRMNRISTSKLNDTLSHFFEQTPPPSSRGYDMRVNYLTQVNVDPPVFAIFLNNPKYLKTPYKRFIERKIRENFDFEGTPISLVFRKKN